MSVRGEGMELKFHAGELAQIKSTGEVVTINAISPGLSQTFYLVFQNGKKNRYKEDELIPYVDKESELMNKILDGEFANAESFQKYAYYRLFSESQEGNLYSYQGNKIIFNPFQYKPLLKFLGPDSDERLLIADEVGVGKTIEAGIIIDELISRGDIKHKDAIMIVCPSVLCTKWKKELRNKFLMDDFYIHDGKTLSFLLNEIKETGKIHYTHSIVSEQLFRGEKYQELLKECLVERGEAFFSLLIVDECHHYRNVGTNTNKFGKLLSLCSDRVIMLSATPFNLRSDDFYNQLHMLNPTLFPEQSVFNQLLKQIRNVNKSISLLKKDDAKSRSTLISLVDQLKTVATQNQYIAADFVNIYEKIVRGESLSTKDKVDFEKILEKLNPISSSFTRTLKRDAIEHRVTRETMTLEVHYTPEEAEVYNSFLEANLQRYRMLGISERAFGLILNGLERIAASSIAALEKNVNKFIHMPIETFVYAISEDEEIDMKTAKVMHQMLEESYSDLMRKIKKVGRNDSKYNTFKRLVENVHEACGENRRIIVFSFYTETLKYLRRRLVDDGYNVALMYGKTPEDTPNNQKDEDDFPIIGRNGIMKDFESGKYEILLVSEVGGEGLDFQFCSALINYDLPYNPMRIEQRIGRIDRMGQASDKIIIGNLCIENTIDVVINRVLLSRIADATDLVGEMEPIIAQGLAEINELIITKEFTIDELQKREKEIEQRIEKAKQTREEFEEARYELVNDKGFRDEFEDTLKKSRISPHESLLFTYSFLKKENGCSFRIYSDTSGLLHVSNDMCERIRAYIKKMNLGKNGEELQILVDNKGELLVDFDGNTAYHNKEAVFFKPSGAWIHFVIDYLRAFNVEKPDNLFYASIKHNHVSSLNKGRFWLFSYEIEFDGFFNTKTYEYLLCKNDASEVYVLNETEKKEMFQNVKVAKKPENLMLDYFDDAKMRVEDTAEQCKEEIAQEAISRNSIKIGSRIEALRNLSKIRIRNMENELVGASGKDEERLRRAIEREKKKTVDKIKILEEKLKYVGTYSLDAICLLDVI